MPKKSILRIRSAVQVFFFLLVALITLSELLLEAGITIPFLAQASLHAICPFGGVVSIYNFATVGTFVQKIHESAFILMVTGFLISIAFGPVLCGWVCPLGSFQEWTTRLSRAITGKKTFFAVPPQLDKYLRFTRYIILAAVVYVTATSAKLAFQEIDPYFALFNFWSDEVSIVALSILGVTILLSLFIERPWCKYACPYGAVLGIFNLFRIFKIKRNPTICVNCKACDKVCPMNIQVSATPTVTNHQCISCLQCTSEQACPIPDTVEFATKGGTEL